MDKKEYKKVGDPVSIESQQRLIQIMNDSPSLKKLAGTEWEIRALKPAVQWMIAEEAVKIAKDEDMTAKDIYLNLTRNMPSVFRIMALALLNDKKRIEEDYNNLVETLKWESDPKEWAGILLEVLNLIDVDFFFATTGAIRMFQTITTERKITMEEREQLTAGRNGGK